MFEPGRGDRGQHVALVHVVPDGHAGPDVVVRDSRSHHATRRQEVAGTVERAEQTVVEPTEQPGSERDGERPTERPGRFTHREPTRVLEHLGDGPLAFERDDLSGEPAGSDLDELVHDGLTETVQMDDGTVDAPDATGSGVQLHSVATSSPSVSRTRSPNAGSR